MTLEEMRAKVEAAKALAMKKWGNKRCSVQNRAFACIEALKLDWVLKEVLKP